MNEEILKQLVGKIIIKTTGERQDESFEVETACGFVFVFFHDQDCCENVYLEEVIGDVDDLIGEEVILAEEVSNANDPSDTEIDVDCLDSWTWTFYRLATKKGLVVLRFLGSSNGYYSEGITVSCYKRDSLN